MERSSGVIARYRRWLPVPEEATVVCLGEGSTPLLRVASLSDMVRGDVWVKVEGMNPTGSFKDRGMTVAITQAKLQGSRVVICASTGNTSAAAAAYAAQAGIRCVVLLPAGAYAAGKLAQAVSCGADVVEIDGNFDQCLSLVRLLAKQSGVTVVNSINPYRLEGQKTAAFEVCDELGFAPDLHLLPVGNAANLASYWNGYREYADAGRIATRPKMWGFQAAGSAPLVLGHPVDRPETIATAIRIGRPASGRLALKARDASGGVIESVTDEEILSAQAYLGQSEGIFVEPASAAGVAGLILKANRGEVVPGLSIVITVTGSGLKDVDAVIGRLNVRPPVVAAELDAVVAATGLTGAR